ncbi:MAG: LysR family transcriptional regulator [Eubacterium sp.]|nr:LysR family transcriptional regulator [Eubacterium sp.]
MCAEMNTEEKAACTADGGVISEASDEKNSMSDPVRCTLRIRLQRDEPFWGIGVSQLLHGIEKTHSLRAAAQNMRISYSKAWKILHQAEMALDTPLLNSTTGGQDGGGSSLTDFARRLLHAYDNMMEQTNAVMQRCYEENIIPILSGQENHDADMCHSLYKFK